MTRMDLRAAPIAFAACVLAACGSFAATQDDADASADGASPAIPDAGRSDAAESDAGSDASVSRSARYEALVKSHAPAAYWRFIEGTGTVTTSIAGEPYVLLVQAKGPSFEPTGLFGAESRSIRFASTTTSALVDDSATRVKLVGPNTFAIEAWIELGSEESSTRWLVRQTETTTQYGMFVDGAGFGAELVFQNGDTERVVSQGSKAPGWHHIVMARSAALFQLWVDGVKTVASPQPGTLAPLGRSFFVGGDTQTTGLLSNGTRMAEVAAYDHELTDVQILEHHAAGVP